MLSKKKRKLKTIEVKLEKLKLQFPGVDFYKIEKMLELINKVNSMSNSEMELMKKLLNS